MTLRRLSRFTLIIEDFFNLGGLHLNWIGERLTANLIINSVVGENKTSNVSSQVGSAESLTEAEDESSHHHPRGNVSRTYYSFHGWANSNRPLDNKNQVWVNKTFRENFLLESLTLQRTV